MFPFFFFLLNAAMRNAKAGVAAGEERPDPEAN